MIENKGVIIMVKYSTVSRFIRFFFSNLKLLKISKVAIRAKNEILDPLNNHSWNIFTFVISLQLSNFV